MLHSHHLESFIYSLQVLDEDCVFDEVDEGHQFLRERFTSDTIYFNDDSYVHVPLENLESVDPSQTFDSLSVVRVRMLSAYSFTSRYASVAFHIQSTHDILTRNHHARNGYSIDREYLDERIELVEHAANLAQYIEMYQTRMQW